MSMNLDEMKLAVCEKLPELLSVIKPDDDGCQFEPYVHWREHISKEMSIVNWPTEGLQVCHEAEKKLSLDERNKYTYWLSRICEKMHRMASVGGWLIPTATYEQRLEALCCVWFPERFQQ